MATITTTTTTTTETTSLPVDQQSIVITPSRNLDTLLSIQNEVSQEEADQISEIQLYNLLEPDVKSTIVTLDNDNNKKWIVIDWVTGHLNDSRLGFTEQGLKPKPNLIRRQLMQQQYGYSEDNNSNNNELTLQSIDFQGEGSDLDMPETLIKYFINGQTLTIYDEETGERRQTNGKDFFKALQKVMKFHLNKLVTTDYDDRQNSRLYRALLRCFMDPARYIFWEKIEKIRNKNVEVGMRMNFKDNSKIVKQVLISQRKTKNGDGLWTIQIAHTLGLGYDPDVLNLYFVIMRLDHYNENKNDITEALNNCYKDKELKLDLIRLESGFLFESDALSGQLDQMATKKAGKKRGKFSRKLLKDKLMAELIGNDNNNNNNNNNSKKKKKKKKRRKPNPETGSSSSDPIDLTKLKALKF